MDPTKWRLVKDLFEAALEKPGPERRRFVDLSCGDDAELRDEVLALLRARSEHGEDWLSVGDEEAPEGRSVGDYEILEELGRGGMGIVYRARQRSLDRVVALKVLPWYAAGTQRAVERFQREARAIAKLRHPGIAEIYEVGEDDGLHFFSMELLAGGDLGDWLRRTRDPDRPWPADAPIPRPEAKGGLRRTAEIVAEVARALHDAHGRGIVHRDVTPNNVLFTADGRVKVVDFGIARDESLGSITRTDEVAGTLYYMSPEQARRLHHRVDHRTDVYSLGVILYEMLTHTRPFDGDSKEDLLENIEHKEARPVRSLRQEIPRDLAVIVHTAMAKEPAERYDSAGALADDLQRFLDLEAIHASTPSLLRRLRRVAVRHRRPVAGIALILLVALLSAWWSKRSGRIAEARSHYSSLQELRGELSAPLAEAPDTTLRELAVALERCRAVRDVLDDADAAAVDELHRQLLEHRDREFETQQRRLEETEAPGGDLAWESWSRMDAFLRLQSLAQLFPDDGELQRAVRPDRLLPRVRVEARRERRDGAPIPARVSYRPIGWRSGCPEESVAVGPAPQEWALPPGQYRIVVEFEDGGFRECTRELPMGAGVTEVIAVRRAAVDEAPAPDMARFEAVRYQFPATHVRTPFRGESRDLEAYLLDWTEVSNAEYQDFLDAHPDRRPPKAWIPAEQRSEAWGRLPASGMSSVDMRDCAEWMGKRLPTTAEWERAARGLEGRPYPWGELGDEGAPPCAAGLREERHPLDEAEYREWYLRFASPVDAFPEARTPEGLYNMYGNVSETTATVVVIATDDGLIPLPHNFEKPGLDWRAIPGNLWLDHVAYTRSDWLSADFRRGFRCARSLTP